MTAISRARGPRRSRSTAEPHAARRRQDPDGRLGGDRPDVPVHPDPAGHPALVQRGGSFIVWARHYSTKWWGAAVQSPARRGTPFFVVPRDRRRRIVARSRRVTGVKFAAATGRSRSAWSIGVIVDRSDDQLVRRPVQRDRPRRWRCATRSPPPSAAPPSPSSSAGSPASPWLGAPGRGASRSCSSLFLILVTPEIMDAIALLGWFVRIGGPFNQRQSGRSTTACCGCGSASRCTPRRWSR